MKATVLGIFFIVGALASTTDQDDAQFKALFIDPVINKLPPDLSARITNGVEAVPHSIPYQAYLIITGSSGDRWSCGGSLISPKHVLTSGHCVNDGVSAAVYLGAHNLQVFELTRVFIQSRHLIRHENYSTQNISNDIGVIVFSNDVELNEYVNVVALPPRGTTVDYEGANVIVSGWGRVAGKEATSPVLVEVNSTVITNASCRQVYPIVIDSMMCISGVGGVGSCQGDWGGPLVYNNVQIGIVSYGVSGCPAGYPSGFTRISSFLDWLEEKTALSF